MEHFSNACNHWIYIAQTYSCTVFPSTALIVSGTIYSTAVKLKKQQQHCILFTEKCIYNYTYEWFFIWLIVTVIWKGILTSMAKSLIAWDAPQSWKVTHELTYIYPTCTIFFLNKSYRWTKHMYMYVTCCLSTKNHLIALS